MCACVHDTGLKNYIFKFKMTPDFTLSVFPTFMKSGSQKTSIPKKKKRLEISSRNFNDFVSNQVQCPMHVNSSHRYTQEIPEPAPFLSRHVAQIESSGFSRNQNNRGLYLYCGLSVKKIMHKNAAQRANIVDTFDFCLFFVCGWQKSRRPPVWAHGWRRHITLGGKQSLGSPLNICGSSLSFSLVLLPACDNQRTVFCI